MRFYDSTTCLDILHRFNKIKPWKFSKCGEISEKASMVWSSFVFFSLHLAFYGDIYIYRELPSKPEKCIKNHIENGS